MKFTSLFMTVAAVAFFSLGSPAAARADDAIQVCAAVQPCDAWGNVLEQYAAGACLEIYIARCQGEAVEQMAYKIAEADKIISDLRKKNASLRKKIKKLVRSK